MASMETRDGVLDRFEHAGLVVHGCPPAPGSASIMIGDEMVILDTAALQQLIHALECALVPYGEHELAPSQ